ncbi:MAG: cytochrome c biogenesis CcdA family protein [Kiritimatiellales bacterium]
MSGLFTQLTHALEGSATLSLAAALLWGMLSLLMSPCHLAAIPAIIGLADEQNETPLRRIFNVSFLFALGILLSIALIGIITAAAGRILGDIGSCGSYIAAAVFFLVGLQLIGVVSSPWKKPAGLLNHSGAWSALITGLLFGVALGPCTFAFMAPVLAVVFKVSSAHPAYAVSLLLAYGIGHCTLIVLAGMSTGLVSRWLNWNGASGGAKRLRQLCGILVILAGLYLIYSAI